MKMKVLKVKKLFNKKEKTQLTKRQKQDRFISVTFAILLAQAPLGFVVNLLIAFDYGEGFIYDTLLMQLITYISIGISLLIIAKRLKFDILFVLVFFGMSFLTTYLFYPKNRVYMFTTLTDLLYNPLYIFFFLTLMGYIITRYLEDFDSLFVYLRIYSIAVVILSIYSYIKFLGTGMTLQYMVFSYNMLVPVAFLIITGLHDRKMKSLMIGIAGAFLILISGARGPLICLLFSIVVYMLFIKIPIKKKLAYIGTIGLFFGIISIYFTNILEFLITFTTKNNISSRTIILLKEGAFFDDSGRGGILEIMINGITLTGKGLFGDRVILGGMYAHNLIYELLVEYGIFLGLILTFTSLYLILLSVLTKDIQKRNLAIILLSTGFLKLMLSSSYLIQEPTFYMLLALGMNELSLRKSEKKKAIE